MSALVFVVDMLNGFVRVGNLHDKEIEKIIPYIIEKIKLHKNAHFICDSHQDSDLEMKEYPLHCLDNSYESEIVDELREFILKDNITLKRSNNGFFNFDKSLIEKHDKFIITGCCSDICVLQFALSLKIYLNENNIDKQVIVPLDCIQTYDSPQHNRQYYNEIAVNLMKNAGIKIEN